MSQHARLREYAQYHVSPVGKAILAMAASMRLVDLATLAKTVDLPTAELHHLLVGSAPPLTARQRRALEDFLGPAAASLVLPPSGKPGPVAAKTARITGLPASAVPARIAAPAVASASRRSKSSRTTTQAVAIPAPAPSLVRRGAAARGRLAAPAPTAAKSKSSVAAQVARLAALSLQVQELQQEMSTIISDLTHRDLG